MRKYPILGLLICLAVISLIPLYRARADTSPTIWTNQADYSPGDTVYISGMGWQSSATINVTVVRPDGSNQTCSSPNPGGIGFQSSCTAADSSGNFTAPGYQLDGITGTYNVTATDGTSTATTTFTDAYSVTSVSVGGQSPNPAFAGGTAQYTVTVKLTGSGSYSASLSMVWTPPTGASASFTPPSFSCSRFCPSTFTGTSTLRISSLASTPAGTYSFQVKATSGSSSLTSSSVSLVLQKFVITGFGTSDSSGNSVSSFLTSADVYAKFSDNGPGASQAVNVYIVSSPPTVGQTLTDIRGFYVGHYPTPVTVTSNGQLALIWSGPARLGTYYFVMDGENDGVYDTTNDLVSSSFTVNGPTLTYQSAWGTAGNSNGMNNGQFFSPQDAAVSNAGNVYILDPPNGRIQEFTSTGTFIRAWGSFSAPGGSGKMDDPLGFAYDSANDRIYVSDTYDNLIQVFDSSGNFLFQWGGGYGNPGSGNGQLNTPIGIAADPSGNVYVCDTGNNRVEIFDANGNYRSQWSVACSYMAISSTGLVVVNGGSSMQEYYTNGTFIRQFGSSGTGNNQFNYPKFLTIDNDGIVYITDELNGRIDIWASDGTWAVNSPTWGLGALYAPWGIAFSAYNGNLYLMDGSTSNAIKVFTPHITSHITVTSSPATGTGFLIVDGVQYSTPYTFAWIIASLHTIGANSPVSGGSGVQYVWSSWSDTGSQSHTVTTPTTATTITANYQTQYWASYTHTGCAISIADPSGEWVNSGGSASGVYPSQVTSDGTRCNLVSDNRPSSITAPTTVTATYQTQYYVTYTDTGCTIAVTDPSSEWVNAGSSATGTFPPLVSNGVGNTQCVFQGDNRSSPVNAPATVSGSYQTQYLVTYTHGGCVIAVTDPSPEWVNSGSVATGAFPSQVVSADGMTRCNFVGDNRPNTTTSPIIVTGSYQTQYFVQYNQTGCVLPVPLPAAEWVNAGGSAVGTFPISATDTGTQCILQSSDTNGPINAPSVRNGDYQSQYLVTYAQTGCVLSVSLPASEWVNLGGSASGVFPSQVMSTDSMTRCNLASDNRPGTITAPTTVTGSYQTQYFVTYIHTGCVIGVSDPLSEWVNSGGSSSGVFPGLVSNTMGNTQCVFQRDDRPSAINAPTTVTGYYQSQYLVQYSQSGCVLSVSLPTSEWANSGGNSVGTFPSSVIDASADTQCLLTSSDAAGPINGPSTRNGNYQTQYWITYSHTGCAISVSDPLAEWVNSGSSANGVFPSQVTSGGTRCNFVSDNRPNSITTPTTISATYQTQYYVTYTHTGCALSMTDPSPEWVNSGSSASGAFPGLVSNGIGTQCVFQNDNRPSAINAATLVTGSYQTQYLVTYTHTGCVITVTDPSSEWVNSGLPSATVFPSQVTNGGIRCNFVSDNRPSVITSPTTVTGTYQTQYLVQYSQSGCVLSVSLPVSEWVNSGGNAVGVFPSPVTGVGTQCLLTSYDAAGPINAANIRNGTYQTQYYVTYNHTGCVISVTDPSSQWVNSGSTATGAFPVQVTSGGTRCNFVSDNRPNSITSPTTVSATYQTQYDLKFTGAGLDSTAQGAVVSVTIGANPPVYLFYGDLTKDFGYVNSGTAITYTFISPIPSSNNGERFVFTTPSPSPSSPFSLGSPTAITGTYKIQYFVQFTISPSAAGTTSPSLNAWYDAGSSGNSISETANNGYTFTKWTFTCVSGSNCLTIASPSSPTTTLSVSGPGTITAGFTINTAITYTGATSGHYSDSVSLSATLKDAFGHALVGYALTFTIGSDSGTATTGTGGIATTSLVLHQPSGSYSIAVTFAGDPAYTKSSSTNAFTINPEPATITYTGVTSVLTTSNSGYITLSAQVSSELDDTPASGALSSVVKVTFEVFSASSTTPYTFGPYSISETSQGVGTVTQSIACSAIGDSGCTSENSYMVFATINYPSVNKYYSATDSFNTLTIYTPNGQFVTLGGWVMQSNGFKANFGGVVRYKSGTQPTGSFLFIYRAACPSGTTSTNGICDYMIKTSSWQGASLAFSTFKCPVVGSVQTTCYASFQITHGVLQVLDSVTGAVLLSQGSVKVSVGGWDMKGNGGTTDMITISITYPAPVGGVTSYQLGTVSNPVALAGGRITVHSK